MKILTKTFRFKDYHFENVKYIYFKYYGQGK